MAKRLSKKGLSVAKLPEQRRATRVVQAEIDSELFDAADRYIRGKGLHIRDVVAWAFESFLLSRDPKAAARFGIAREV